MCPILHVCRSKYYAWRQRGRESPRARSDRRLLVLIRSLHQEWKGILGFRRMCIRLRLDHGESIGIRRVRRLMRSAGLSGVPKKRRPYRKPVRTDPNVPDLLQREFSAQQPNQAWVTDITEFRTGKGKLYLCVIKDLYDGTVVSWKTHARPTADLVVSTVQWAVEKSSRPDRKPMILHSDHGSQYTSLAYRKCVRRYGLRMSMGRVRTCADNASAESVFAQLKRELVHRCRFRTRQEATERINQYFLNIYNPWRPMPISTPKPNTKEALNERINGAFIDQKVTKKLSPKPCSDPTSLSSNFSINRGVQNWTMYVLEMLQQKDEKFPL